MDFSVWRGKPGKQLPEIPILQELFKKGFMELNHPNGTAPVKNKEVGILRRQDEQIALLIVICLIIDNVLPVTSYNILQLKMCVLMHRQMPFILYNKGQLEFLSQVPDMHPRKLQLIPVFLQGCALP